LPLVRTEVARIEMQARSVSGEKALTMMGVFRQVYAEHGVGGLFKVRRRGARTPCSHRGDMPRS
jgi:hypothetical protein